MNLTYLVSKRTNGANPFKIFESIPEVSDAALATRIRGLDYGEFLETAYWFAVSHVAKSRAGMRCQVCNSPTKIAAHHRTYDHHGSEHLHMNDITVLCENCHGLFHGHMEAPPTKQVPQQTAKSVRSAKPHAPGAGRIIPHTEADIGLPDGDHFTLTLDLINACRTNGAFTNATMGALGLTNPLVAGWASRLIGKTLTRARYRDALEGRFIYARHIRTRRPDESEFDEGAFLTFSPSY